MILDVQFAESNSVMDISFGELHEVSDGGYDKGYTEGYDKGVENGYSTGYTEGETHGKEIGYDEGYDKGVVDGYADGELEGKKIGFDEYRTPLWNSIQDYGNRDDYNSAFVKWSNASIWLPIHDITPKNALAMFREFNTKGTALSLPERCEQLGISISFSQSTAITQVFQNANIYDVGIVDCTSSSSVAYALSSPYIVTATMVVNENNTFNNTFSNASSLINLIMRGTIGTAVSFGRSPLSVESMKSIISTLKNYSGTDKEFAHTVTFSDNCWAELEADSTAPDGGTWKDYVSMALCWNV